MFNFLRNPLRNGCVEQCQMDSQIRIDMIHIHEYIPNGYRDGQFLLTLPDQGLFSGFTRLYLAAYKLPEQPAGFVRRALAMMTTSGLSSDFAILLSSALISVGCIIVFLIALSE